MSATHFLFCTVCGGILKTALSGAVVFEKAIKEMPAYEGTALQTPTHTFLDKVNRKLLEIIRQSLEHTCQICPPKYNEMQLFQYFFSFIFFPACFAFEKEMAVNKHGHDSVQGLPVPIMLQRDHHNERWPWHNWDSSQGKPGGWSERENRKCCF